MSMGTWEHKPPEAKKKPMSALMRWTIAMFLCVFVMLIVVPYAVVGVPFPFPKITISGMTLPGVTVSANEPVGGSAPVVASAPAEAFPVVDTTGLSSLQIRILELLRQEYEAQRPGTFYSEGVVEPWCADFVSWIMREAGAPVSNPNTGYWRIPGVYTLEEYYSGAGRFTPRPEGYVPQVGDVILYDAGSNFGEHSSFVVISDGERVVTVGANKRGKDPKGYVTIDTINRFSDPGIIGYGVLSGNAAA